MKNKRSLIRCQKCGALTDKNKDNCQQCGESVEKSLKILKNQQIQPVKAPEKYLVLPPDKYTSKFNVREFFNLINNGQQFYEDKNDIYALEFLYSLFPVSMFALKRRYCAMLFFIVFFSLAIILGRIEDNWCFSICLIILMLCMLSASYLAKNKLSDKLIMKDVTKDVGVKSLLNNLFGDNGLTDDYKPPVTCQWEVNLEKSVPPNYILACITLPFSLFLIFYFITTFFKAISFLVYQTPDGELILSIVVMFIGIVGIKLFILIKTLLHLFS